MAIISGTLDVPSDSGVYELQYATKLQERLSYPTTWKEVCNVIYTTAYTYNIPYMSTEFSAATGTRGSSYVFSAYALTNEALTISTYKIVPVFIDQADLAQCTFVGQMEVADRQGHLLNEAIESAVLADYGNWTAFDNASIGGAAGAITVSSSNIDKIIRAIAREIRENNAQDLADRNGKFIVWRAKDMESLEEFAQANGFNLADTALKEGLPSGYHFMGFDHYISNLHTSNYVMAGVKKIHHVGILSSTYGQIKITQDPASGVTTYGPTSGIGVVSRADFGVKTPTGLVLCLFAVQCAA